MRLVGFVLSFVLSTGDRPSAPTPAQKDAPMSSSREKIREAVDDVKSAARSAVSMYSSTPAVMHAELLGSEMQPVRTRDGCADVAIIPAKKEKKDKDRRYTDEKCTEYVRGRRVRYSR